MKVGVFHILHSNCIQQVYFPDAVVGFVMNEYNVSEDAGAVSICIDSGVTGGFQTDLTVTLIANDGAASKYFDSNTVNSIILTSVVVEDDTDLDNNEFSLVFPAGSFDRTLCASIPITNDTLLEGNQDFNVTIIEVGPHALINDLSQTTKILIIDNDCKHCKYSITPELYHSSLQMDMFP